MSRRILRAYVLAGRPCLLAVGLYGLGVRIMTDVHAVGDPVVVVHEPVRTLAQAEDVLALAEALAR